MQGESHDATENFNTYQVKISACSHDRE